MKETQPLDPNVDAAAKTPASGDPLISQEDEARLVQGELAQNGIVLDPGYMGLYC